MGQYLFRRLIILLNSAVAFLASVVDAKIAEGVPEVIEELKSRLRSEANKESTGEDTSQESALEKAASVAIGSVRQRHIYLENMPPARTFEY